MKPTGEEKAGDWGEKAIERIFTSLSDWEKDFEDIKLKTTKHGKSRKRKR